MRSENEALAEWIEGIAKKFIDESPENTLKNDANEKAWDEPLIGFSNGSDPLYQFYRKALANIIFPQRKYSIMLFLQLRPSLSS